MAAPDDPETWERGEGGGITLFIEPRHAREREIEFLIPNEGNFTVRRA